jgi:hypothetical protein
MQKKSILAKIDNDIAALRKELRSLTVFIGSQLTVTYTLEETLRAYFKGYDGMFNSYRGKTYLKVIQGVLPIGYNADAQPLAISIGKLAVKACYNPEDPCDAAPAKAGNICTYSGTQINTFWTADDLINQLKVLYPLDILKTCYQTISDETARLEKERLELRKTRWDAIVSTKKSRAEDLKFKYNRNTDIDTPEMLTNFLEWFNLFQYAIMNPEKMPDTSPLIQFEKGTNDVVIGSIVISIKFSFTARTETYSNKTITTNHVGVARPITEADYETQGDLYDLMLTTIPAVHRMKGR